MDDRPQVPGWNNINLNKPEEYSSEFVIGNLRYANVTNVSTGQRQLYLVSGLFAQRSPLIFTNSDGSVTKQEGYDSFVRQYGANTLTAADKANKQQSVKLLSTPGVSTQTESKSIKDSTEFKSTTAGNNSATSTNEEAKASLAEELSQSKALSRSKFPTNLKYPADLQVKYQDVINFSMLEYKPRELDKEGNEGLGGIKTRESWKNRIIGNVYLPIPGGISDTNAVTWGNDSLTAVEAGFASIADSIISGGGSAGADTTGNQAQQISQYSTDVKNNLKAYFTGEAIQKSNILSRTQGAIQNPNMELLFNGPTLRPFNFTFKLSARDENDRDQIRQIIRFFKQGMAVQRSKSNLFLKAPHTFKIQYLHKEKDHPYINYIKECALQSFTVNYTPEGNYMTFADGLMTSYEISMQFQELEPIFNDDYSNDLPGKNNDREIGY